jgi:hypothetical protein
MILLRMAYRTNSAVELIFHLRWTDDRWVSIVLTLRPPVAGAVGVLGIDAIVDQAGVALGSAARERHCQISPTVRSCECWQLDRTRAPATAPCSGRSSRRNLAAPLPSCDKHPA